MGKGKRYTQEQILKTLQEIQAGKSAAEVARTHAISVQTLYRWQERYGGIVSFPVKWTVDEENYWLEVVHDKHSAANHPVNRAA